MKREEVPDTFLQHVLREVAAAMDGECDSHLLDGTHGPSGARKGGETFEIKLCRYFCQCFGEGERWLDCGIALNDPRNRVVKTCLIPSLERGENFTASVTRESAAGSRRHSIAIDEERAFKVFQSRRRTPVMEFCFLFSTRASPSSRVSSIPARSELERDR